MRASYGVYLIKKETIDQTRRITHDVTIEQGIKAYVISQKNSYQT